MERSLTGSLIGRVGPFVPWSSAPRGRGGAGGRRGAGVGAGAGLSTLRHPLRATLAAIRAHRRLRIALLCLLLALPIVAGGWLALRHSPLSSVEHVRVSGVHGPEAAAIESALVAAAHGMSTLAVNTGALNAAVARFHVVSEIKASASFPHSLEIVVGEQPAVAALVVAGARTAVAADGVVLGQSLLRSSLPTIGGYTLPLPGKRVDGPNVLAALSILGAAPTALARHVSRAYAGPEGLTLVMSNGLLAYFGDGSRPHAKWLSFERVLTDPSSAGASYIDVRLPERPAAGFPAGVTPPDSSGEGSSAGESSPLSQSESTVGALAAGLSAGTPAGAATTLSEASSTGATAGSEESEEPTQEQSSEHAEEPVAAEAQGVEATDTEAAGGGN
jgi:cell division protein FtsQ